MKIRGGLERIYRVANEGCGNAVSINMDVKVRKLISHYDRVCRKNLKANCKCCQKCPFIEVIKFVQRAK